MKNSVFAALIGVLMVAAAAFGDAPDGDPVFSVPAEPTLNEDGSQIDPAAVLSYTVECSFGTLGATPEFTLPFPSGETVLQTQFSDWPSGPGSYECAARTTADLNGAVSTSTQRSNVVTVPLGLTAPAAPVLQVQ